MFYYVDLTIEGLSSQLRLTVSVSAHNMSSPTATPNPEAALPEPENSNVLTTEASLYRFSISTVLSRYFFSSTPLHTD